MNVIMEIKFSDYFRQFEMNKYIWKEITKEDLYELIIW